MPVVRELQHRAQCPNFCSFLYLKKPGFIAIAILIMIKGIKILLTFDVQIEAYRHFSVTFGSIGPQILLTLGRDHSRFGFTKLMNRADKNWAHF